MPTMRRWCEATWRYRTSPTSAWSGPFDIARARYSPPAYILGECHLSTPAYTNWAIRLIRSRAVAIARPIGMPGQDQAKTTPLGSVGLAAVHCRSSGFEACYRRPIRLPDDLSYTRDRCVNTMTILCGNETCPFLQVRAAERRRRRPLWKTDGGGGQLAYRPSTRSRTIVWSPAGTSCWTAQSARSRSTDEGCTLTPFLQTPSSASIRPDRTAFTKSWKSCSF